MSIPKNIAEFLHRYKDDHHLSIAELAEELCVAKSIVPEYLNGSINLRADTMEQFAEKCKVSVIEMISAQPPGWEQVEITEQAARLFSDLPPGKRDKAVALFLSLIDVLSEED